MSEKLTPQEAYDAAKKLWPKLAKIKQSKFRPDRTLLVLGPDTPLDNYIDAKVNWPDGIIEWPVPPVQYRDAVWPDDYGKPAIFADHGDWSNGTTKIVGYDPEASSKWISNTGLRWQKCRVKVDESVEETKPAQIWRKLEGYEIVLETDEVNACDQSNIQAPSLSGGWINPCRGGSLGGLTSQSRCVVRRAIVTYRGGIAAGDGYRILDPEEKVKPGDEFWHDSRRWKETSNYIATADSKQSDGLIYRRKIT